MSPLTFIGNWAAKSRFWPLSNTKIIAYFFLWTANITYVLLVSVYSLFMRPIRTPIICFCAAFWAAPLLEGPETLQNLLYSQRPNNTDDMRTKVLVRITRPHSICRALQHSKGVKVWAEVCHLRVIHRVSGIRIARFIIQGPRHSPTAPHQCHE